MCRSVSMEESITQTKLVNIAAHVAKRLQAAAGTLALSHDFEPMRK